MSFLGPFAYGVVVAAFLAWAASIWFRRRPLAPSSDEAPAEEFFERCRLCPERARRFPLRLVRDTSIVGFVREAFGAPPRYRIAVDVDKPYAFCVPHAELARTELALELARLDAVRVETLRDVELALAHFELVGLDARLAAIVSQYEHAQERDAYEHWARRTGQSIEQARERTAARLVAR